MNTLRDSVDTDIDACAMRLLVSRLNSKLTAEAYWIVHGGACMPVYNVTVISMLEPLENLIRKHALSN